VIDDVGDLFHELMSGLLKIQVGVHVDGDSETTTDGIKKEINLGNGFKK
jgi:hypothetical protein